MSTKLAKMPIEEGDNYKIWENKEFECWGTVTKPQNSTDATFTYPDAIKNKVNKIFQISISPYYNYFPTILYTISTTASGINVYFNKLDGNAIIQKQEGIIYVKGKLK